MREEQIFFGAGRATFIFPPEIECFASIILQEEARLSVAWKIYEPIFLSLLVFAMSIKHKLVDLRFVFHVSKRLCQRLFYVLIKSDFRD